MRSLSTYNIESELSYAYLHAVASKAGMACEVKGRHADNNGVDAELTAWGPFPAGGYLHEIDIKVQLKATVAEPADDGVSYSYFLRGVDQYNDLRTDAIAVPRILVVLFLPRDPAGWMLHTQDALALYRCAYWVSLRGAAPATGGTGVTVKLPKDQHFSPDSLIQLATRLSRRDIPLYAAP